MSRKLSLSIAQVRVRKALAVLIAAGIDPSERASFFWQSADGEGALEIAEADFFSPDAPPGVYVFKLFDAGGKVETEFAAVKLEVRLGESMSHEPNARVALERCASVMLNNAASEVDRGARRLTEAEAQIDKLRNERRALDEQIRERDAKIAGLERALDEADQGDDMARFADVLGEIAIRVLGLDAEDASNETAGAVETVLEAIRRSADAQRALSADGAGPALRLLGIGNADGDGDGEGAPCL